MKQMQKKMGLDEALDALEREVRGLKVDLEDQREHVEPESVRYSAPFTGAGLEGERESIH